MMTTAKQRAFLLLLRTVHDRWDAASFDAHVRRGNGKEILCVYPDVPNGDTDEGVLALRSGTPMGEAEPLIRAGYIETSGGPPPKLIRIWLSPEGRAFVENDFREPLPPPRPDHRGDR
jgi:hypothetical protein